jgi:hypothetical protein
VRLPKRNSHVSSCSLFAVVYGGLVYLLV